MGEDFGLEVAKPEEREQRNDQPTSKEGHNKRRGAFERPSAPCARPRTMLAPVSNR